MPAWLTFVRSVVHGRITALLTAVRRLPPIDESKIAHIFRAADGHLAADTLGNRRLLRRVAGDPANRLGEDRFGVVWAAQTMPDGSQVWVQIWNGRITNGGVNVAPRNFNFLTGLSAEVRGGRDRE
jgi:hypothetical protein